jgi:uncharacterized membrane protein
MQTLFGIPLRCARVVLAAAFMALVLAVVVSAYSLGEDRAVLVRNSLVLTSPEDDLSWTPETSPQWYVTDREAASPFLQDVIVQIRNEMGEQADSELVFAKGIIRHLHQTSGREVPIRGGLEVTYTSITEEGLGYCADYTRIFMALARTAGIEAREWGMGFTGMGPGHTFVEIFDSDEGGWVFLDPFFGFSVQEERTGRNLSLVALGESLGGSGDPRVRVVEVEPGIVPFPNEESVLEYYASALDFMYVFGRNDIIGYDQDRLLEAVRSRSRAAERLWSVVSGSHPQVIPYRTGTDQNLSAIQELQRLRVVLLAALSAWLLLVLIAGAGLIRCYFARKPSKAIVSEEVARLV